MDRQSPAPVLKDLVLLGGGHSHLEVLRRFAMSPLLGLRITLVSEVSHTAYSGMLPGLVSGIYAFDEAHIDLVRLCRAVGARFIRARAEGLDCRSQRVRLAGRPDLPFDLLSINVGAAPDLARVPGAAARAVPIKPVPAFLAWWRRLEQLLTANDSPFSLGIVGGGAGGVEIALAIQRRLAARHGLRIHLFEAATEILPGFTVSSRRQLLRALERRGIAIHLGHAVAELVDRGLRLDDGSDYDLDRTIWTTGVAGPNWLTASDLALDPRGFIAVEPDLRARGQSNVFAAGDVASLEHAPRPKSGVFAVRQGPKLAENLRRSLLGQPLVPYRPQRRFLSLLSTADGSAVAARGTIGLSSPLAWRWKDWIDRRFMARYAELPVMASGARAATAMLPESAELSRASAMRCKGCGAKLSSGELERVLTRLHDDFPATVADAPSERDDGAVTSPPPGRDLVQSLDLLPALLSDPFLFGRITANHCLSDLYAMGAQPWTALAAAGVPFARTEKREEELYQLLAGAAQSLREAGAQLIGGHSGESEILQLGFSVTGLVEPGHSLSKAGLRESDVLILTKPLGTGVLFAGEMRGRTRGRWLEEAVAGMLRANRQAAELLQSHGASAMTDVTGFGLAGHLLEMLSASGKDAELELGSLPALDGALELLGQGLESSIAPANRARLVAHLRGNLSPTDASFTLLCDPQTSGGLLAALPEEQAEACLAALHRGGDPQAAVVGRVTPRAGSAPAIGIRGIE